MTDYLTLRRDRLDEMIANGRRWRENYPSDLPLPTNAMFGREGEMVGVMSCKPDFDFAMNSVSVAAVGFRADMVLFAMESWYTDSEFNPETGEPWAHEGMSQYVENHPDDWGPIKEALNFFYLNEDGTWRNWVHPFVRGEEGEITWEEVIEHSSEDSTEVDTLLLKVFEKKIGVAEHLGIRSGSAYSEFVRDARYADVMGVALEALESGSVALPMPSGGLRMMASDLYREHVTIQKQVDDGDDTDPTLWRHAS